MPVTRRTLLARLGAGAAAAVAAPRIAAGSIGTPARGPTTDTVRPGQTIRLNRNENAYGPSSSVVAAMRDGALSAACRYPDVEVDGLRRTIARFHGVPMEHVVLGCGSAEILRMAVDAFAGPRKRLVAALPTFDLIGAYAQRAGAEMGAGPLRPDTPGELTSHRLPDGVNVLAARAAATALEDAEHVRTNVSRNTDDRQEFLNQANARMLRSIDSLTNFVMLHTGGPAAPVVEHLRKHSILVAGDIPRFDEHIRVSLGTPSEMREFWRVWGLMPGHRMSM